MPPCLRHLSTTAQPPPPEPPLHPAEVRAAQEMSPVWVSSRAATLRPPPGATLHHRNSHNQHLAHLHSFSRNTQGRAFCKRKKEAGFGGSSRAGLQIRSLESLTSLRPVCWRLERAPGRGVGAGRQVGSSQQWLQAHTPLSPDIPRRMPGVQGLPPVEQEAGLNHVHVQNFL